jgi:hypothetical protein
MVKRKAKCPLCGEQIYVRTTQELFTYQWLTERQARAADWMKSIENFGLGLQTYREKEELLRLSSGAQPDPLDVIWEMIKIMMDRESTRQSAYHMAAQYLDDEGQYFIPMLRRAHALSISNYAGLAGVDTFQIEAEQCCEECYKQHGKIGSLDKALKDTPLPIPGCTRKRKGLPGFCTCYLSPQFSGQRESGVRISLKPTSKEQPSLEVTGCIVVLIAALIVVLAMVVLM